MVKIVFYGEEQQVDQIPESYYDFVQIIGVLFSLQEVEKLTIEYTSDNKKYKILNEENFRDFFLNGNSQTTVYVYSSKEESNSYRNRKEDDKKKEEKIEEKEDEDEEEEINLDKNDNKEIKVPEITREMVIASIVKQVKENIQKSKILLMEKEKKEEEERKKREKEENERKEKEKEQTKEMANQINNLITNRLDNLKDELINESQIKFSQIVSESQINLKNIFENNIASDDENKEKISSLEEHPGISCTKCGKSPITGNRYCCVYCKDVNYCENCEEKEGLIHGHPLYKFKLRIN